MKWPWRYRQKDAERKAAEAEAKLRRAQADYLRAHRLAEASRKVNLQNGFADLIRTAMGVER
jgi:hypothetical protein